MIRSYFGIFYYYADVGRTSSFRVLIIFSICDVFVNLYGEFLVSWVPLPLCVRPSLFISQKRLSCSNDLCISWSMELYYNIFEHSDKCNDRIMTIICYPFYTMSHLFSICYERGRFVVVKLVSHIASAQVKCRVYTLHVILL